MKGPKMDEAGFIEALRALAPSEAARGLMDDAAVLETDGEGLVLTHDVLVEGVHVLPGSDMADIGWKLVATNVSDLAAKGAEPVGALLGHMLGDDDEHFLQGFAEALEHYGMPLLGGDTVSAKKGAARSWGLTAIGRPVHRPVPSRSNAQVGDALWLTGRIGAAMVGYEVLRDGTEGDSTAYRRPMARLPEGIALAPHVTAMMDVSDGLLLDAFRMAQASQLSLSIDSAAPPLAVDESRRQDALRWGEDYELLFTLPGDAEPPVPATRIGQVELRGFAPLFLDGEPLVNADGLGWQHTS